MIDWSINNSAVGNKIKIRFILNPFSGVKRKSQIPRLLKQELNTDKFEYDFRITQASGHAAQLSREAVDESYDAVVIIGGDGSINEVGTQLIGSEVALGIIPGGSGNGVARSLGIEMNTRSALRRIQQFNRVLIDTGQLDGRPFIGISGIGFDAHISDRFLHRKLRGKLAYGYVMMKEFNRYNSFEYSFGESGSIKAAFVMAFANTSQYGNNAVIAPLAEFQDGELELVCIEEMRHRHVPGLMYRLFNRSIDQAKMVETMRFKELHVSHSAKMGHVDGEPFEIGPKVTVKVLPQSLWVLR